MINYKYKIFDYKNSFTFLLLEVGPDEDPHLVPRYELVRWTYRNGICIDSPQKNYQEENFLPQEYNDFKLAHEATNKLNEEHKLSFLENNKK